MSNLDRLKSNLQTSKVKQEDQPLFQVISQLIDYLNTNTQVVTEINEIIGGGDSGDGTSIIEKTYLTDDDETDVLVNSRRLLAGDNVIFDDSVFGERTVGISAINEIGYWTPLVNVVGAGDVEMVVTDGGQPIAVWNPTP